MTAPYTYHNGQPALAVRPVVEAGIASLDAIHKMRYRKGAKLLRRGSRTNPALLDWNSLPDKFRAKVEVVFGPFPAEPLWHLQQAYDLAPGCDRPHPQQALIRALQAVQQLRSDGKSWDFILQALPGLPVEGLPRSVRRLRELLRRFEQMGCRALQSGKQGNQNRRKITPVTSRLLLNLYVMNIKPNPDQLHRMYEEFRAGALEVVDRQTGEWFDPSWPDFPALSKVSVWREVRKPVWAPVIARLRDGAYTYRLGMRPHHHRSRPKLALSKITMDDRDISHTLLSDGTRVKAYYVFDEYSQCIIAKAYSKTKDTALVQEVMRDLWRFLRTHNVGIPREVNLENHLMRQFEDALHRIFPLVHWSLPQNPQEKWAETGIRLKKYGPEKLNHPGVGRFYASRPENRPNRTKIHDEHNDTYKYRTASYEAIVAGDLADIEDWNNSPHPLFKGKTRWEVLMESLPANLPEINTQVYARAFGHSRSTSIRRNDYIRLMNQYWWISGPEVLERLAPNNYKVQAYWLEEPDGRVEAVYLYQDDRYVDTAVPVQRYNTARAEWTDTDRANYELQAKRAARFDKYVKDLAAMFGRIETWKKQESRLPEPDIIPPADEDTGKNQSPTTGWDFQSEDWARRAVDDI